jgi:tRNA nucleotidyltransferase (CCA-adding enzyme)
MREEAGSVALVSAERNGGGLHADGLGELSKLLLGVQPAKALRLARDTGVLSAVIPEFEPAYGYELKEDRQPLPLDEHIFTVVQGAADEGAPLAVRLAALLHDLGKPMANGDHADEGAEIADRILERLRYPTRMRAHVTRLIRSHSFEVENKDEVDARRFLRSHGDALAFDLVAHKEADLLSKNVPQAELEAVVRFRRLLQEQRAQPHHISHLAVDGNDLIGLGFTEGPELGRALESLLDDVGEDPSLNTRDVLLERAERLRP